MRLACRGRSAGEIRPLACCGGYLRTHVSWQGHESLWHPQGPRAALNYAWHPPRSSFFPLSFFLVPCHFLRRRAVSCQAPPFWRPRGSRPAARPSLDPDCAEAAASSQRRLLIRGRQTQLVDVRSEPRSRLQHRLQPNPISSRTAQHSPEPSS